MDIDLGNNITIDSPILLIGQMVGNPTTDEVHFKGRITVKLTLVCVQCLKKFEETFDIAFEKGICLKARIK